MSKPPSEGVGRRLATYRRISGYSARELAERAGYGLTRGVIANIESGRKTDITVDQLIALSTALAIPPAALALPVDEPFRWLRMSDGEYMRIMNRAHDVVDWFEGAGTWFAPSSFLDDNPSTRFATERIARTRDYVNLDKRIDALRAKVATGDVAPEVLDEALAELEALRSILRQLEVDPTSYTVDDEPSRADG